MPLEFPNESSDYRDARNALLEREKELRREMEAVAEQRRALPVGGEVPTDYVFATENGDKKLSELFANGHDSLAIYSMMFPRHPGDDRAGAPGDGLIANLPLEQQPCPSCTALIDTMNGANRHIPQRTTLIVSTRAPIEHTLAWKKERGWDHLTLVSAKDNDFSRDYHAQSDEGASLPMMNVFVKDADGTVRHTWGSELGYEDPEPGQDPRALGPLESLWNTLDLIPEGRGDWNEQLTYD
jgi:predicted dithiol-disulfide oxidoreductase (DUF899 family)